ncbi:MAG: AarF/ABC1/UbiB kinase family protein [Actinobacteria bacterium]|nr:AarF/ABC1/UbiB kinase family protein [Actinomycetota bacterium]
MESRTRDVTEFAFTDTGPWVVDPDELAWSDGLASVRASVAEEAAALLRRRRRPPVGRIVRVVAALARALVVWRFRERGTPRSRAGVSRRLRLAFERLGSTYVKLGQIVSAFEGLFPDELVREFKRLRDQVPPERFRDIRAVVEEELGGPLHEVFASFDEVPIAAASIAQVHGARLLTGEDVVVKVQRPRVGALVRADLRALAWIGPHLVGRIPVAALANPPALVELFAEQVTEELDFRLEAENMLDLARVFAATQQRTMVVPRPHPTLVTRRVLVMERMRGFAFDDVAAMHAAAVDTTAVLRAGLIACLEGAMIHGVFHGDLHGGNLLVEETGRTVLFDFGITGRLTETQRLAFLRLLLSGTSGDMLSQLAALRDLGAFPIDTDLDEVLHDLELDQPVKDPTQMSADELVSSLEDLMKKLLGYGTRAPKELMLFVKDLMYLNAATATLAPDLDLIAEIVHIHQYFLTTHGERLMREIGEAAMRPPDPDAIKASFLVPADVERLTFADLQERRKVILGRMGEKAPGRNRRR